MDTKKILCTLCKLEPASTPNPDSKKGLVCNNCWLIITKKYLADKFNAQHKVRL